MNKKIAILRGINVGGRRKILMADLRSLMSDLGFTDVKTYIQSGNIIFNHNQSLKHIEVATQIEEAITKKYGFDVSVIVLSAQEIATAVQDNPFYKEDEVDIKSLHLTFLKKQPTADNLANTQTYNYEPDRFVIQDKNVFLFCPGKYHKSKLTNNFFEKKLKVTATTRNWKTVLKLLELSM